MHSKIKAEAQKAVRIAKQYQPSGDDPVQSIMKWCGDNEVIRATFSSLVNSGTDSTAERLNYKIQEVLR